MKQQKRRIPSLSSKDSKPSQLPHVGIIFVVDDRVLIESTPASEGEVYGDFVNHANGHPDYWCRLQADGLVPKNQEYINVPRGRCLVNRLTGQAVLFLDTCISKKPRLVREIRRRLHLPSSVQISRDPHYRCTECLSRSPL